MNCRDRVLCLVAHFHQGKFVERTEPVPRWVAEDILAGSLDDLTVGDSGSLLRGVRILPERPRL
jgi:cystathionine beta-lyase family protein involved in aluminum resistance